MFLEREEKNRQVPRMEAQEKGRAEDNEGGNGTMVRSAKDTAAIYGRAKATASVASLALVHTHTHSLSLSLSLQSEAKER